MIFGKRGKEPAKVRYATPKDKEAIRGFLTPHIETSMFLLGNLDAHGVGLTDHPNSTLYAVREEAGALTGVVGITRSGYMMCQIPGMTLDDAKQFVPALHFAKVQGITGEAAQVDTFLSALGLVFDWQLRRDEPLFARDIAGLQPQNLRPVGPEDVDTLTTWYRNYNIETGLCDICTAKAKAPKGAAKAVGSSTRLLIEDGEPVAMASINATAGTAVQVGGVFVPLPLRARHRGRRVTEGILAKQGAQGMTKAVLFAASAEAAKAYVGIGFALIGKYKVALMKGLTTINLGRGLEGRV